MLQYYCYALYRVIFQKRDTEIILIIKKELSLTEVALIDSGADNMNCIQERFIPLKYYEKNHLKD